MKTIQDLPSIDFCLKLTLVLILLHGGTLWHVTIFSQALVFCAFFMEDLRKNPLLWFALTLLQATGLWLDYQAIDNHQFLLAYWSLALFFVCLKENKEKDEDKKAEGILARNGNFLCGMSMFFAVFWKAFLSPDFSNSQFLSFTFLTDERFKYFTHFLTAIPLAHLEENYWLMEVFTRGDAMGRFLEKATLHGNPMVNMLAQIVTWWTLLIEGSIAFFFLMPRKFLSHKIIFFLKHTCLLVFLLTTYPVATVTGFGWLLANFGIASLANCSKENLRNANFIRSLYFLVIVLLQLYSLPFGPIKESFMKVLGQWGLLG